MPRHDPAVTGIPERLWPAADREAWRRALAPRDLFDVTASSRKQWKVNTVRHATYAWGGFLAWLERTGRLNLDVCGPAERATREFLAAYVDSLRERGCADNTIASKLEGIAQFVASIDPEGNWAWITRAAGRVRVSAVLVRDPIDRIQPAAEVLNLGFELMAEGFETRTPAEQSAAFRDGLMIALLVQRPLRLANFTHLTLGRDIECVGGGWRIRIPGNQTKTGEACEFAWPNNLVGPLESYLRVHRPVLIALRKQAGEHLPQLWISGKGRAMGVDGVAVHIKARTEKKFGRSINPHTFRTIAATTVASAAPECVADISAVLGHTTLATSEKYYNRATRMGALDSFHGTVKALRNGGAGRLRRRPITMDQK